MNILRRYPKTAGLMAALILLFGFTFLFLRATSFVGATP